MPKSAATGKKSEGIVKKTVKRGGPKSPEFSDFLTKLRKNKCPEVGCSTAAMHLMNDLVSKLSDRIIAKTGTLARYDNKSTMKSKHASTASNLVLVGPLASHAYDFAQVAVSKYTGIEAA